MARSPREIETEVYPEADGMEGFPHPRQTRRLFGHADAARTFAEGIAQGRLHHAWLVTGPAGIGKATLAYHVARAALAAGLDASLLEQPTGTLDVSPDHPVGRLVTALSHPDLLLLRRPYDIRAKRFRTAITVDEVRRLRDFLGHKQTGKNWKVVIVDSADELNVNAANALLKSLEEPPARTLFLLLSSMPGRLLVTIRSRCRHLALHPLRDDDLRAATLQAFEAAELEPPAAAAWQDLVEASSGSVGRLLSLAAGDGLRLAKSVDKLLTDTGRRDWTALHQISDELSGTAAAERFDTFIDLLTGRLARLIHAAATDSGAEADLALAGRLGIAADLASWAELWETLTLEKAMLDSLNLDRKAFVLDCAMRLDRLTAR